MTKSTKKRKKVILSIIILLLLATLVWTIWGNKALELNTITVTSKNLPEGFSGYKIALVSDLHNTQIGNNNEKLIGILKQASPDMIAITGDLIDSHRLNIEIALDFAKQALEIAPCYYVSGNHEGLIENSEYIRLKTELESLGVTVLDDKEALIERNGEKISLIGIDDPLLAESNITPEKIRALSTADGFTILLSHRPEIFEAYVQADVDLSLCGHVHGGQFRLPFIGGLYAPNQGFFPKYDSGLYSQGNSNMIVSRGIGNSTFPLRFNNRPEVVLIELKNDN